jgi:fibro-slime domain-containing protein
VGLAARRGPGLRAAGSTRAVRDRGRRAARADDAADGATDSDPDDDGNPPGEKFDVGAGTGEPPPGGRGGDCITTLEARVRDFYVPGFGQPGTGHPDFERDNATSDLGIVDDELGPDGKPAYAGSPTTPTTSGKVAFDQWYRDVPDVNLPFELPLPLTELAPGVWGYDDDAFFPVDGMGFGDYTLGHNYHFTLELHTTFSYDGGEVFTFRGDDDLFVFVNGRLAIDLGGVHPPLEATVDFDARADELGLSPGHDYPLDFFFAERHTEESNFHIETTIACFLPPAG